MSSSIAKILTIALALGTYSSLTLVLVRFAFMSVPRSEAVHRWVGLARHPEPDPARINSESPDRLQSNPPPSLGGAEADGSEPA